MKILLLVMLLLFNSNIMAQSLHFFGSVKGAKTTINDSNISFDNIMNKPTVSPLSTAGVSVDAGLGDKIQALAQFLYTNDRYMSVDLLQFRYTLSPDILIRIGKQRLPLHFHSENIQVQALLPWMTSPREVYQRIPIYSFTGLSVEQQFWENKINLHFYAGDTKDEFLRDIEYKLESKNLIGTRLNLKFNNFDFYVNYYRAEGDLALKTPYSTSLSPAGVNVNVIIPQSYHLESVQGGASGFKYQQNDFFLLTEYSLTTTKNPAWERAEAAYISIGNEFKEKWIPVLTFSTDLDVDATIAPSKTSTYSANVNYRIDYNNILKLGVDHVDYKKRTVLTSLGPFSEGSAGPAVGENFQIYSFMWAFVY